MVYVPALPLSWAVAIHFRDERDLREHRARTYANVHLHDALLRVSPALFTGESSQEAPFTPPPQAHAIDWGHIDRIRGAMSAAVASVENGKQLEIAGRFLGLADMPAGVTLPQWMNPREIDDLPGTNRPPAPQSGDSDIEVSDQVGFRAAYSVLGDEDATKAWSPNGILDAVTASVGTFDLPRNASHTIARNLQRVRAIVNVETDFEPFRPTGQALVSIKALLLVLLRPDLKQLLEWPATETGADDLTRVTAAVLAGRLRGLAREATDVRSVAFDDMTARWAARAACGRTEPIGNVQITRDGEWTSLSLDRTVIAASAAL
ncbi:hypothetical protein CH289_18885 [Rhodococcus sp. RS1C4]|nr:hypothetical protein CH289_18885 [Rhodococcus sp. RS1C4]